LQALLYADDIGNTAEEISGLKRHLETLAGAFREHGLRINFSKTKFMVVNPGPNAPNTLEVDGQSIDRVSEFPYLGSLFTDNSGEAELENQPYDFDQAPIQHRIIKANKRFSGMYRFFRSRAPLRLKIGAFFAFVYPVATWGCEAWTVTEKTQALLDVWMRSKMRRMLGSSLFDRMTNEELHARTASIPLTDMIRERRLRYLGHIVRYPSDRWVRLVLNAEFEGYNKGSQKKTWLKTIAADLKSLHASWEDCLDRNRWRDICSGEIVLRAIDQAPTGSMRYEMRDRRRGAAGVIDGGQRRIGD